MADLITYVPDLQAMRDEGLSLSIATVEVEGEQIPHPASKLFSVDENGDLTFNVTKIPVVYTNDYSQSLCLVRGLSRADFEMTNTIHVIGECINNEYVFDSEDNRLVYESVYDTTERTTEDGYTYTPPYKIGVFA